VRHCEERSDEAISVSQIYRAILLAIRRNNDDRIQIPTMTWHYEIKEYYDYADNIEGVNIHYLWTPLGGVPDWDNQRVTRFMPRVQPSVQSVSEAPVTLADRTGATTSRLRRKILKLPQKILDPQSNTLTNRYLLHHYFEVFQDGHRQYSPLYTEELDTRATTPPATAEAGNGQQDVALPSFAHAVVKKSTA
jgi:hypothetical protein